MDQYIEFIHQHMLLSIVWVGLVVALIVNFYKSSTTSAKVISPSELTFLTNKEGGVVVDIRSQEEFKRGHITGARHVLPSDIKGGNFSALESHKSDPIIVVCKTGQTARESAELLAKAGFEKVSVLKNGLISWNEANLPLVRGKK
ncbi:MULTISPECIES: rhodanese-like domain-containing protein [Vibrio]|uniref:Rhodanese-like domain-containing protein n=2 Tax=Vibrio TaxID=662 RepID=A0A7X4LHY3_9VIBR|nr:MULTISPECIES: rhodanese-like domain-containing protein [Vibrio]MBF9001804.1 rhodanese-like domain-containing protein [Vibrio nitrifigilis]MZI92283.1 rhodanese-like domain-containing protein [Vibrio eleionomae]